MGINQYVYFALWSDELSADQIADRVGLEPDERVVRGARSAEPPDPVAHAWKLVCRKPGMRIDEQAEAVLSRLEPIADQVRALTAERNVEAVLQFVRYFNDDDAPPAPMIELFAENGMEVGPEPNYLVGWHLPVERLHLIANLGASIDCDEYS